MRNKINEYYTYPTVPHDNFKKKTRGKIDQEKNKFN